jgi:broad specificity phosphatase PhoE
MRVLHRSIVGALVGIIALVADPGVLSASAQEAVFVVRHAERLDASSDSPLSSEGNARAAGLAAQLRDARITSIFVTQFARTADTAKPLADRLGLALQRVPAAQTPDLIARLRALGPDARVLVVGHSDTVPKILNALGSTQLVTIGSDEYDNLFVVLPRAAAAPTVLRLRY